MSGRSDGESERRLKKAMDKLYYFPKSSPSTLGKVEVGAGFRLVRGSRVPAAAGKGLTTGISVACRPWDRSDLMRRLASFKAMTWFAKPKVVGPVNCARRGWTNVEPDIIVCEACGARLMFSTPSSWTSQQVDKAAAVFSLKLDNGHKLLCPWIDNVCDESLALFPPTPPQRLVQNYNECLSNLLQLSALPKISSVALDCMKRSYPQLEQMLGEHFSHSFSLNRGFILTDGFQAEELDSLSEDASSYHQALNITSLCGWEPRLLPYVVDGAPKSHPENKFKTSSASSEKGCSNNGIAISVYSPGGREQNENGSGLIVRADHSDTASVVLDCRFCGARVAFWGYSLVNRPLQLFKLIADSNRHDERSNGHAEHVHGSTSSTIVGTTFDFSIAGGPPPTKQNFCPRVSFPVVSRHLKADIYISRKNNLVEEISTEPELDDSQTEACQGSQKRKRGRDDPREDTANSSANAERSPDVASGGMLVNCHFGQGILANDKLHQEESRRKVSSSSNSRDPVISEHSDDGALKTLPSSSSHEVYRSLTSGVSTGQHSLYDRMDEFDPIKQHRTFCPWVASGHGGAVPGWKQTVSAISSHGKRSSNVDALVEVQRSLHDEGDDPVAAVRRLFTSPPTKRFKTT